MDRWERWRRFMLVMRAKEDMCYGFAPPDSATARIAALDEIELLATCLKPPLTSEEG
jgi:hypothetical protein